MMLWRHLRPPDFISRAEREKPSYVSQEVQLALSMTSCCWLSTPLLFWRCLEKERLESDPDSSFHIRTWGGLTSSTVLLILLLAHFSKAHYGLSPEMKTAFGDKAGGEGATSQRCSFSYGGHSEHFLTLVFALDVIA